jgi:hypothetical protein
VIRAYFDRNVFQDLYERRNGVTRSDVERLRSAIRHDDVSVAVSMTVLEETLARWATQQRSALAGFRFVLELAGLNPARARVVKEAGDLLGDEIWAYAAGAPAPQPYVVHDFTHLVAPSMGDYRYLDEFVADVRAQKEALQTFMEAQRRELAAADADGQVVEPPRIEFLPGQRRGFNVYWSEQAEALASGLAERAGVLREVQARGMDGLLNLRPVRMAVGVNLILAYTQLAENRAPQIGDSRDVHHATSASVAEVFVTNDATLAPRLRRIPDLPVEVIDLRALFCRLNSRSHVAPSS